MIPETKNDSYVPFGEEWEKEMMKNSKPILVRLYKISCQQYLAEIERIKELLKEKIEYGCVGEYTKKYTWDLYKAENNL